MNRVYVCTTCGKAWAGVSVGAKEWYPERRACCLEHVAKWEDPFDAGSLQDWRAGWHQFEHDPFAGLTRAHLLDELGTLSRTLTWGQLRGDNWYHFPEEVMQELSTRIAELRSKLVTGKLTDDELREALRLMREERVSASIKSAKARSKTASLGDGEKKSLEKVFGL